MDYQTHLLIVAMEEMRIEGMMERRKEGKKQQNSRRRGPSRVGSEDWLCFAHPAEATCRPEA